MDSIYLKNIEAFEKVYGKYNIIENNKYEGKVEDTKCGNKTIKIDFDGKKIYLNSKYDTISEAKKMAESIKATNSSAVFSFGLGFGYHIKELIEKINDLNVIIVYEPDLEIFDIAMRNIDLTEIILNKNIQILLKGCYISKDTMRHLDIIFKTDIVEYTHSVYKKVFLEEFKTYLSNLKEFILNKNVDLKTSIHFREAWAKTAFSNINYILKSYDIKIFKEKFKDKPAIVVSAGPSLSKNIHLLKKLKGKVLILAVFSVTKALKKHGIIPDFIFTIDTFQFGMTEFEENIPLVYLRQASSEILSKHKGKKIYHMALHDEFYRKALGDTYEIDNIIFGPSVACFAVGVAMYFGCNNIILIGQDMCYTEEATHVEGTDHEELDYYYTKDIVLKDIYGNTVYTNTPFKSFLNWFEDTAKTWEGIVNIVQATEGGLAIENAENTTLQNAIDKYCENNYTDIEATLNKLFDENGFIFNKEQEEMILNAFKECKEELEEILPKLEEAVELSAKLYKNIKYSNRPIRKNQGLIEKLEKIDEEIKKGEYLRGVIRELLVEILLFLNSDLDEGGEKETNSRMNQAFYTMMKKQVKMLIKFINEEVYKIKEESEND